ncbi:MAG: transposase [Taibaiella sp.]|nr:transposase [Taibaiella sp.]
MPTVKQTRPSPAEKKRMIEKSKYWLFEMGMTQKQVAENLNISPRTMNNWVKRMRWQGKLKGAARLEMVDKMKYRDSLNVFMAYLKAKHPAAHDAITQPYKEFIKRH